MTSLACAVSGLIALFAAPEARAAPESKAARSEGETASAEFDMDTLKARGIDPALAAYFKDAPRFTQGGHVVTLLVNGVKVGKVDARFDADGQLCFDDGLIARARFHTPGDKYKREEASAPGARCYDFVAAYPQTEVTLRPNREEVAIVVSQDTLIGDAPQASDFSQGGFAAIANYDVMGLRSGSSGGGSNHYLSASTQLGFNLGDWIVRSRQIYVAEGGRSRFDHLYTYAQRTFADQKAVFQAGQININSPLFSGAPITGVQVLPELALNETRHSGALVEGIAPSQATVEVRQAGVLVYTTMVPEGQFALTDIPLLNSSTDLTVTVREANGNERQFVVPAASFRTSVPAPPGYTFALGKVRDVADAGVAQPMVATGTGTWNVGRDTTASAGALVSPRYQSAGWGADTRIFNDAAVSVRNTFSNALDEGVKGAKISASMSLPLPYNAAVSASATQQTRGYREFAETLSPGNGDAYLSRYKGLYTASLSWAHPVIGGINMTYSANRFFDGRSSNRVVASWGRTFRYATVNASIETSIGGGDTAQRSERAAYVNVSIPLGKRSVQTYARQRGDRLTTGVAMSDIVSDQVNYRISAERNNSTGATYASGNLSLLPRYTAVDLGYSQSGATRALSGRISGGVVAHQGGVTLSPYEVQDTFGIVNVPGLSGVKLTTPYGPVWTDFMGQAVVPLFNAYRENRIEVQTRSLPRRVDLRNGVQTVGAGRGSVNFVSFDVIRAQRFLITAVDENGNPLPKGALVLDGAGNFLTTVLDDGTMFLSDVGPESDLRVTLPDAGTCRLEINFPEKTDHESFYDTASATCRR